MMSSTTPRIQLEPRRELVRDATRARRGSFRVLVVDDNLDDRELTIRYLKSAWPFEHDLIIAIAANAEEALEKLSSDRCELVLLDWNMPGTDGGALLQKLRNAGWRIPVVIVTGREYEELADAICPHQVGYLNKDRINDRRLYCAVAAAMLPWLPSSQLVVFCPTGKSGVSPDRQASLSALVSES